ncbi:MAG: sugar phosphate isomerase/epimerase [Acidobacteriaceae bacterium]|nr:sugar phosphate isomerase/epimerase [Acidobacteriaceae bacterium]
MRYSRREFGKLAISSLPVAAAVAANPARLFAATKPNSKFNGVQIGVISYSYRQMPQHGVLDDLKYMVENGINACELETIQEEWAGAPKRPMMQRPAGPPPAAGAPRPSGPRPEMAEYNEALTKWRTTMPISKYEELRKIYADAGVWIYAFKAGLTMRMPDAEFDYVFNAAKACGANHVTMEMPDGQPDLTKRIGEFGAKHKMMIGYHAHLQALPTTWDEACAQSPYNGINLDLGHYTAAGNKDQIEFVKKHHDRITSMHLKDRKSKEHGEANTPWGEGDTPLKEVLQLMKKEGYKFPATIEVEYPIPDGSDSVKEVGKCLAYAKAALA